MCIRDSAYTPPMPPAVQARPDVPRKKQLPPGCAGIPLNSAAINEFEMHQHPRHQFQN